MEQRKTWQLWTALSGEERRDFLPWLQMKLGKRQQFVQQMAKVLYERGGQAPTEPELWRKLYRDQPYDDARLRKLLRDLCQWLERYLSLLAFEADPPQQSLYLLRSLLDRDRPDLFVKRYRREVEAEQSTRYPYEKLLLYQRYLSKYQPKARRQPALSVLSAIDRWWCQERLEIMCNALTPQSDIPPDSGLWPDAAVHTLLEEHLSFDKQPQLAIYFTIYRLLRQEASGQQAQAWLMGLRQRLAELPGPPPVGLLALLLNQSIRTYVQSSRPQDARLAVELGRLGLDMGWLLISGALPWDRLRSLVNLCLQSGDLTGAEALLDDYLPLVPAEQREEAAAFHRGNLDFAREAYAKVIRELGGRRFSNPLYEVQARSQVLMSHYTQTGTDPVWLVEQIDQLGRYLREQALGQAFKAAYRNQLRLLRRLVLANQVATLRKLETEIAKLRPLNQAAWLATEVQRKRIRLGG